MLKQQFQAYISEFLRKISFWSQFFSESVVHIFRLFPYKATILWPSIILPPMIRLEIWFFLIFCHRHDFLSQTKNEATWCWCEPTCLCLDLFGPPYLTLTLVTFDLDPCDLLVTCQIHYARLGKLLKNIIFWSGDLDLWPMTLTLDLDIIKIHLHTKFHGPRCYSYQNMNYCLVNFGPVTEGQTDGKWRIRAHCA